MKPQTITTRQATLWLSLYYSGSAILVAPTMLASVAKQDAWLAVLLALGMHYVLLTAFGALGRLSGKNGVGEFLAKALGKPVGKLVLLALLLTGPIPISIFNLRDLLDFTTTDILNRTPMEAIAVLELTVVVGGLFLGVRALGRAAELFFPIVLFLTFMLVLSQLPDIHPRDILPVGEYGVKPILAASFLLFGYPYMEPSVVWMIGSKLEKPAQLGKAMRVSAAISGFFFLLVVTLTVMRAGPELAGQLSYPTYFMAKMISIGSFYQRVEALLSFLFFLMIFFRMSLLLYVSATGISELFSIRGERGLLVPLGFALIPLALTAWSNPGELIALDSAWYAFRFFFGILLPLAVLAIALLRRKKTRSAA